MPIIKKALPKPETEMPKAQSLSIAYSVQRQAKRNGAVSGSILPIEEEARPTSITEAILAKRRQKPSNELIEEHFDDVLEEDYDDSEFTNASAAPTPKDYLSRIRERLKS